MSLIYCRTVSFSRPRLATTFGDVGRNEGNEAALDPIFTDIPCSIQAQSLGSTRLGEGLPGDSAGPVKWNILIPKSALAKGVIKDQDIATDDEGNRYQVAANYWNLLGYNLGCVKLEN